MADLFLSHSSSDVDAVRRLRQHLEAGGYSCWMAPDDVSSAGSWAQQIVDAIQSCRVIVVLLSERSVASDHVSREVGLAVQAGKPILPVRIERVMLSGTLAYMLHLVQWVDAFPGPIDTHIDDIGFRVADLVRPAMPGAVPPQGPPPQATPPPPRATAPPQAPPSPQAATPHPAPASRATPPPPAPSAAASAAWSGAPVAGSPVARAGRRDGRAGALALGIIAGGVAVAAGSVLPWATATAGPMTISLNGLDREGVGIITGALGVILAVLGLAAFGRRSRVPSLLALIAALIAGLMGVAEAIYQRGLDVDGASGSLSLGFGLLVLIAGAIVAGLSAAAALVRQPERSPAA